MHDVIIYPDDAGKGFPETSVSITTYGVTSKKRRIFICAVVRGSNIKTLNCFKYCPQCFEVTFIAALNFLQYEPTGNIV
jgi:hypothetical protein